MDALDLLRSQHMLLRHELTVAVEDGTTQARMRRLAHLLLGHMVVEEHLFYPRLAAASRDEGLVARCAEEHMITRFALGRAMAGGPGAVARFGALRDVCIHHMEEEEQLLFPRARRIIVPVELSELGRAMADRFERAIGSEFGDVLEPDGSLELRATVNR